MIQNLIWTAYSWPSTTVDRLDGICNSNLRSIVGHLLSTLNLCLKIVHNNYSNEFIECLCFNCQLKELGFQHLNWFLICLSTLAYVRYYVISWYNLAHSWNLPLCLNFTNIESQQMTGSVGYLNFSNKNGFSTILMWILFSPEFSSVNVRTSASFINCLFITLKSVAIFHFCIKL